MVSVAPRTVIGSIWAINSRITQSVFSRNNLDHEAVTSGMFITMVLMKGAVPQKAFFSPFTAKSLGHIAEKLTKNPLEKGFDSQKVLVFSFRKG